MKNILIDKSIKLLPKEEMLEVKQNFKSLSIGIPKESSLQEKRVALTPESVELLVNSGHKVYVEKDAGNFSNFYNHCLIVLIDFVVLAYRVCFKAALC